MAEAVVIKPCPFCGKEASIANDKHASYSVILEYWIECDSCTARGEWDNSEQKAIEFWNRRVL